MTREQWRNAIEAIGMISDTDRSVIVETAYSSEAGQLAGSKHRSSPFNGMSPVLYVNRDDHPTYRTEPSDRRSMRIPGRALLYDNTKRRH